MHAPGPHPEAPKHLFLASFQMFLTGSIYALGVFNRPIEESAAIPGALDGVWASAMALMSLVATPTMLLAGVALNAGKIHIQTETLPFMQSKTHRVRFLGLCAAAGFASLALGAPGVVTDNSALLRAAVALQGIAFGTFYLASVELLAAWMPTHPGLAVGCGQMAFGLGSIAFSAIFTHFLSLHTVRTALCLSAFFLAVPASLCASQAEWPPGLLDEKPDPESRLFSTEQRGIAIPWKQLPFLLPFWSYVATVFSAQAGFAFIPYFFKVGYHFGQPADLLLTSFDAVFLVSTLSRPCAGLVADNLKWGRGFFSLGSKNLMLVLLTMQTAAFLSLVPISTANSYIGYTLSAGVILISYSAGACGASVLARDMFSPVNSSLVYGVGTSIAMGLGEFSSAELISIVDDSVNSSAASKYNLFYLIGFFWSAFGLLASVVIARYEPAFQEDADLTDGKSVRIADETAQTVAEVARKLIVTTGYGSIALTSDSQKARPPV